jgi:putative membrane protein insertion efficiency factor
VHVRTRPSRSATSSGLCDRPRRRPGSDAQPNQAPDQGPAPRAALPVAGRSVPDRSDSARRTTIVRRTPVRSAAIDEPDTQTTAGVTRVSVRLLAMVRWYQRAADGRPSPCRFSPSCSCYAVEALEIHGSRRGLWLTVRRLLRCRPFGPSGYDPVPLPHETSRSSRFTLTGDLSAGPVSTNLPSRKGV